ncbi:MAG: hypothetical protein MUF42_13810 [Cytophagaceae bacterium]|jgi:hypothetical protein|nr:hypothetical protein [Cytophagaceae bacterium]
MKYVALFFLLSLGFFACRRGPIQVPSHGSIQWAEPAAISAASPVDMEARTYAEAPVFQRNTKLHSGARKQHVFKPHWMPALKKPEFKNVLRAKSKELPPGLSNALWIMLIGLGGMIVTGLMLLYFDSTLLLFLFGVIFVVGLVSLIMYKITHKKKIK